MGHFNVLIKPVPRVERVSSFPEPQKQSFPKPRKAVPPPPLTPYVPNKSQTMFSEQTYIRPSFVDEIGGWTWPTSDSGAWDGPSREWDETHRDGYLRYVRNRNVVVQAGGNCGLYPRLFAKYFKTVYTFEPDALNFYCLVNNCQLPNIIKFNAALGASSGMVNVNKAGPANVGMHTVQENPVGFIPQIAIDSLGLPECDLIQLDVEGYEPKVIQGALETIRKFRPVISCENGGSVWDVLINLGYKQAEIVGSDTIFVPTGL